MKKRSKLWMAFLIIGVICTIITRCHNAHAEGWTPPEWVDEFMDPNVTPEPIETPAPTESPVGQGNNRSGSDSDSRSVPLNANRGFIRYLFGTYSYNNMNNQITIRPTSAFGGGSIGSQRRPWYLYEGEGKEFNGTINFTNNNFLQSTNVSFDSVSSQREGIVGMVQYESFDQEIWNNEYEFRVRFNWGLNCTLSLATNAQITLEQFGFGEAQIQALPVTIICEFQCTDGNSYWIFDQLRLADLSSFEGVYNAEIIPDDVYINYINIDVIVNYEWLQNYIYQTVNQYYSTDEGQQIAAGNRVYPRMSFYSNANASISFTAAYSDNAKNRNWLQKILYAIFLPDPDALAGIINNAIGDPSQSGSALVMQGRTLLYDLLSTETSDFVINVPPITVPIRGTNYTVFAGYSFNLNQFYNGTGTITPSSPVLRTLMQGVTFIMSCLIFSAFFQSLWALVVKIFGLHLWQGANGEDLDEVDE